MRADEDVLGDTGILLRYYRREDPAHEAVKKAVDSLRQRGVTIYAAQQNFMEFWNTATRPLDRNGFGLPPQSAGVELARLEILFPLLPEPPDVYPEWRRLVGAHGVRGVQVHDAHLVAVMRVHGLSPILTLNPRDFARYGGITPVHPDEVR